MKRPVIVFQFIYTRSSCYELFGSNAPAKIHFPCKLFSISLNSVILAIRKSHLLNENHHKPDAKSSNVIIHCDDESPVQAFTWQTLHLFALAELLQNCILAAC